MMRRTRLFALAAALCALHLAACGGRGDNASLRDIEANAENASDISNDVASEAGAELPEFKIPAPQASAQMVLPRSMFPTGEPSLQQVGDALRQRLEQAGYDDLGYYRVTNGFALATRMERVARDGRPAQGPARWATEASGLASLSGRLTLAGMLDSLLHADPGSYRVMVFVVTNRAVTNTAAPLESDLARDLVVNGGSDLPEAFAEARFGPAYRVTALIYEFSRTSVGKPARFSRPSNRPAAAQLRLAKILKA